jgi:hypothetical protein
MEEILKQILLEDICSRLPYKIKGVLSYDKDKEIFTIEGCEIEKGILYLSNSEGCHVDDFKTFLRPMSSMTEKERKEYNVFCTMNYLGIDEETASGFIKWLNQLHFDYSGLIEKGLALEAPEGMYNLN